MNGSVTAELPELITLLPIWIVTDSVVGGGVALTIALVAPEQIFTVAGLAVGAGGMYELIAIAIEPAVKDQH
ncbi:hypothetical protein D3C86_1419790 [compost metagenome]